MAGNNGSALEVRTIGEDGQAWTGLAHEMSAVAEEIRALVVAGRQRLVRAADEEMRRVLREAMARLRDTSASELSPQARQVTEAPLLATEVHSNGHEEWEAAPPLNGHKSSPTSPTMESLAESVASQDDTRSHAGTRNGVEDHEATLLEVASNGSAPGSGEEYSGTVQLVVLVEESAIQALQFVDELCRHPSMRLQRLLGTAKGRLDIWVLLREPIHLKEALLGMEGVSQVNSLPAEGPQDTGVYMEVRLKEPVAAHGS